MYFQITTYTPFNWNFNKNWESETKEFVETDLSKTITINIPDVDEMITIVVGFMLDKQQLEILN